MPATHQTLPVGALVFHCGRCGSTLLGRFFETDPSNRVCLEPETLRHFLRRERGNFHRREVGGAFRLLVHRLGARPTPAERRLVVKFNSTAITEVSGIQRLFPDTPLVYLLRDPTEVVASLLAWSPPFLDRGNREELAAVFGGVDRPLAAYSETEWFAWYVGRNLQRAWESRPAFAGAIDYRNHATHYPELVRRISGAGVAPGDAVARGTLAMHAKYPDRPYSRAREAERMPPGLEREVAPFTAGAYARWQGELRATRPSRPVSPDARIGPQRPR